MKECGFFSPYVVWASAFPTTRYHLTSQVQSSLSSFSGFEPLRVCRRHHAPSNWGMRMCDDVGVLLTGLHNQALGRLLSAEVRYWSGGVKRSNDWCRGYELDVCQQMRGNRLPATPGISGIAWFEHESISVSPRIEHPFVVCDTRIKHGCPKSLQSAILRKIAGLLVSQKRTTESLRPIIARAEESDRIHKESQMYLSRCSSQGLSCKR